MLDKEINLNKKIIVFLVLMCILSIGMYSSYAYYEVSVIKNSVIVLKTASIDIVTDVVNKDDNTFTIPKGSSITLTVNLTTELTNQIGYKMYYEVVSGVSLFNVTSTETFTNDIVEGDMTSSKSFSFTFTNIGENDITIKLGTQGGLTGYPILLEQGIELKLNETLGLPVKEAIKVKLNNSSCRDLNVVEEDGITYLSGSYYCVTFNYVWYSGKLWRITAINPDGTVKMITDGGVTNITSGDDWTEKFYNTSKKDDPTYTGSYIYQWLNEDFLDTLYNYENLIVEDPNWYYTNTNNYFTKPMEDHLINNSIINRNTPVGLFNAYDYHISSSINSIAYLGRQKHTWFLMSNTNGKLYRVSSSMLYENTYANNPYGIRPVINLKANILLINGSGTIDDPYKIFGDKEEPVPNTTLLNTRIIGEYVVFDEDGDSSTKELYRIVGIEDEKVKLNKNDYIRSGTDVVEKMFSTSSTYGNGDSDDYWDYYLNNTWYNSLVSKDMLDKGTYYINIVSRKATNYKNSLCNTSNTIETTKNCIKTNNTWNGYVGLPRYGEMFANQLGDDYSVSKNMWLITPYSTTEIRKIDNLGSGYFSILSSTSLAARPSIYLKSNVVITGGDGTKSNPFTIALK